MGTSTFSAIIPRSDRWRLAPAAVAILLLIGAAPAAADLIVLQNGRELNGTVREYANGSFIFALGPEIVSLPAAEVSRILLTGTDTRAAAPAARATPAATAPAAALPPLEIVASGSRYDRGVLIVSGEVRNNTDREQRYVQLVCSLHDGAGDTLAVEYGYVPGSTPHLRAGETRAFTHSFINPPPTTYKYKLAVENYETRR